MAVVSKEQSEMLWLVVLQSAAASHMLWQGKYPQLVLPLLTVTSKWGEEEERGLEQRPVGIAMDRTEWTQQSHGWFCSLHCGPQTGKAA